MTRPKQKEKEVIWLEQFKALYKEKYGIDFTQGQIIPYEGPDFLVNPTFGIEFVELFDESGQATNSYLPAAQDSFRKGIVKEAKKYCEEKGIAPIEVKVWFNPIEHLTGAENQKMLGLRLGRLVEKLSRRSSSSTTMLWEPQSKKLTFVSQISIAPGSGCPKEHRWLPYFITETNTSPIGTLQKWITKKNEKYEGYLENCQECWLVIVVDIRNSAQQFDIKYDQRTKRYKYCSKFDRVFYMDIVRKEIAELEISR